VSLVTIKWGSRHKEDNMFWLGMVRSGREVPGQSVFGRLAAPDRPAMSGKRKCPDKLPEHIGSVFGRSSVWAEQCLGRAAVASGRMNRRGDGGSIDCNV